MITARAREMDNRRLLNAKPGDVHLCVECPISRSCVVNLEFQAARLRALQTGFSPSYVVYKCVTLQQHKAKEMESVRVEAVAVAPAKDGG